MTEEIEKDAQEVKPQEGDNQAGQNSQEQPKPDSIKVLLRRKDDVEPVIQVTIEYKGSFKYWYPPANETRFSVDAWTADAAVRTGGFEVDPESKTKLKRTSFSVEES